VPPGLLTSVRPAAGLHASKAPQISTGWHYSILGQLSRTSFASQFFRSVPFGTIRT
jgi:hypothetical protein